MLRSAKVSQSQINNKNKTLDDNKNMLDDNSNNNSGTSDAVSDFIVETKTIDQNSINSKCAELMSASLLEINNKNNVFGDRNGFPVSLKYYSQVTKRCEIIKVIMHDNDPISDLYKKVAITFNVLMLSYRNKMVQANLAKSVSNPNMRDIDFVLSYLGKMLFRKITIKGVQTQNTMAHYGMTFTSSEHFPIELAIAFPLLGGGKKNKPSTSNKTKTQREVHNAAQTMAKVDRRLQAGSVKGVNRKVHFTNNPINAEQIAARKAKQEEKRLRRIAKQYPPPAVEDSGATVVTGSGTYKQYVTGHGGYVADFLGNAVTGGLNKLWDVVTGNGSYNVTAANTGQIKTNSLCPQGTQQLPSFPSRTLSKARIIAGDKADEDSEFCFDVYGTDTWTETVYPISISNPSLFTKSYNKAQAYKKFKWKGLGFYYKGDVKIGNDNLLGNVYMIANYEKEDGLYYNDKSVSNGFAPLKLVPNETGIMWVECDPKEIGNIIKETIPEGEIIDTDRWDDYYIASLHIITTGMPADLQGKKVGTVSVVWDGDWMEPVTPNNFFHIDEYRIGAFNGHIPNENLIIAPTNDIPFSYLNGGHFMSDPNKCVDFERNNRINFLVPGRYHVVYRSIGYSATAAPTISLFSNDIEDPLEYAYSTVWPISGVLPSDTPDSAPGSVPWYDGTAKFFMINMGGAVDNIADDLLTIEFNVDVTKALGYIAFGGTWNWVSSGGTGTNHFVQCDVYRIPSNNLSLTGQHTTMSLSKEVRTLERDFKSNVSDVLDIKKKLEEDRQAFESDKKELEELKVLMKSMLKFQQVSDLSKPLLPDLTRPKMTVDDMSIKIGGLKSGNPKTSDKHKNINISNNINDSQQVSPVANAIVLEDKKIENAKTPDNCPYNSRRCSEVYNDTDLPYNYPIKFCIICRELDCGYRSHLDILDFDEFCKENPDIPKDWYPKVYRRYITDLENNKFDLDQQTLACISGK